LVGLGRLLVCVAVPCDLSVFILAIIVAKDLSFGAWTSQNMGKGYVDHVFCDTHRKVRRALAQKSTAHFLSQSHFIPRYFDLWQLLARL
jgi:hypothetical protein